MTAAPSNPRQPQSAARVRAGVDLRRVSVAHLSAPAWERKKVGRPPAWRHLILSVDAVLRQQVDASRPEVAHLKRPVLEKLALEAGGICQGVGHFLIGNKAA